MDFYKQNIHAQGNIEIDGNLFIIEEITYENRFPKREYNRTQIISGTQVLTPGEYVPIKFTFRTTIDLPVDGEPEYFDDILLELQSGTHTIISPYAGNFEAKIAVKPEVLTPDTLGIEFEIEEVPEEFSKIPGEIEYVVPEDVLEPTEEQLREMGLLSNEDEDVLLERARESKEEDEKYGE